jgi:cell wall-associated NlpC family hydrolase
MLIFMVGLFSCYMGLGIVQAEEGASSSTHHQRNEAESMGFSQLAWARKHDQQQSFQYSTIPSGWASAGMTMNLFQKLDIQLPHTVKEQFQLGWGAHTPGDRWATGDLLFYNDGQHTDPEWVGIVVDGEHIAYAGPEQSVVYRSMRDVEKQHHLVGARRVLSAADRVRFSLVLRAGDYIGTPYVFGSPFGQTTTFDCSSFTKTIFAKEGIHLPRVSKEQAKMGQRISLHDIRVGDLLFFTGRTSHKQIAHVAMYVGNGLIIHTYGKGGVQYTQLNHPIWKKRLVMARRIVK